MRPGAVGLTRDSASSRRYRRAIGRVGVFLTSATLVADTAAGQLPGQGESMPSDTASTGWLELDAVLESIDEAYPPLLVARAERDVVAGRVRSARGIYDPGLYGSVKATPDGYYEYTTLEGGLEQFLGLWGSRVYAGYRLTRGDILPDYYSQRTQGSGEASVGLSIPILRGGLIDEARADLGRADLDQRAVERLLERQRLDIVRDGTVAYLKWVAAGQKLRFSRQLLQLAQNRAVALEEQVAGGLRADIVLVDNQRLVVSREIAVIEAERALREASLTLSLYHRGPDGAPSAPGEERLPEALPQMSVPDSVDEEAGVAAAFSRRPELAGLELALESVEIDLRLARNDRLPALDANFEAARNYGDPLYSDRSDTELRLGVALKVPIPNRKYGGKADQLEGKLRQAQQKLDFGREKVEAEVRAAAAAIEAARRQTERADLNVELAVELQTAEQALFAAGASDLLSLQIREQAAFDARSTAVEAQLAYLTAITDWRTALAEGLSPSR